MDDGEMPDGIINMPIPRYPIGLEPVDNFKKINQHSSFKFVDDVEEILGPEQFERLKRTSLGPVLRFISHGKMNLSGQLLHFILSRNLVIKKKNELWFRFAGQPMKFSIREFHMVTGLKCSESVPSVSAMQKQFNWVLRDYHTEDDIVQMMREARFQAFDEKLSLGMLVLMESIFLHTYNNSKYQKSILERAQNLEYMIDYPWGIEAYDLLLKSVQKALLKLEKSAIYDIYVFPLALQIWIVESIPKLQSSFSTIDRGVPTTAYLCEKYRKINVKNIEQIKAIEGEKNVAVVPVLPSIPRDAEDTVSLKDDTDTDLISIEDLMKKGYRFRYEHWQKKSIDMYDALQELGNKRFRYPYSEGLAEPSSSTRAVPPTAATPVTPSSSESIFAMLKELLEGQKVTNDRLSKIERKLGINDQPGNTDDEHFHDVNLSPVHRSPIRQESPCRTPVHEDVYQEVEVNPSNETIPIEREEDGIEREVSRSDETLQMGGDNRDKKESSHAGNTDETTRCTTTEELTQDPMEKDETTQEMTPEIFVTAEDDTQEENDNMEDDRVLGTDPSPQVDDTQEEDANLEDDIVLGTDPSPQVEDTLLGTTEKEDTLLGTTTSTIAGKDPLPHLEEENTGNADTQLQPPAMTEPPVNTEPPFNEDEAPHLQVGASVEISGQKNGIWYLGTVHNELTPEKDMRIFVVRYSNLQTTKTTNHMEVVGETRIRPKPPQLPQAEESVSILKLLDIVDAYHYDHWCRGQVVTLLKGQLVCVQLDHTEEVFQVPLERVRIHRDWVNGSWEPPVGIQIEEDREGSKKGSATASEDPTALEDNPEKGGKMKRAEDIDDNPAKRLKAGLSTKTFLRRSKREIKKSAATITPFRAPPNPALTKTPEANPLLDPFKSPAYLRLDTYQEWCDKKETARIGAIDVSAAWFKRIEDMTLDVNAEVIDAALLLFNSRREEHAAYFHNNCFPRASFCSTQFFTALSKQSFEDHVIDVVKGVSYPGKNWKHDVDVVYGMIPSREEKHWIGMGIDFKKREIEIFSCKHESEVQETVLQIVHDIAEMVPALLSHAMGVKPMKNTVPFKLSYCGKDAPKSRSLSNCGVFVLKNDSVSLVEDIRHVKDL